MLGMRFLVMCHLKQCGLDWAISETSHLDERRLYTGP